jgi:RNA-directed DNA polymerase
VGIQRKKVNLVPDADIRGFFMSHEWTMKFIEHRVADRRILHLIQKWLKAGYLKTVNGRRRSWVCRREQWSHR